MNQVFLRDIVIAVLLSIITAILLNEPFLICTMFMYLLMIIGAEEYVEMVIRRIQVRRIIKKLRNRKVLPPASKQD